MNFTIKEIRQLAIESRDDSMTRHMYNMMRFMAGDPGVTIDPDSWAEGSSTSFDDMPLYPEIHPDVVAQGIQNHAVVNSSIMIQNTVYSDPSFIVSCEDENIQAIVKGWAKKRWSEGSWADDFYQAGMEVEAAGLSAVEIGIDEDGKVGIAHVSCLDMLWDRSARKPSAWEYVFVRKRLSKRQAKIKYPWLSEEEIAKLTTIVVQRSASGSETVLSNRDVIIEWSFWANDAHVVFLGGIQSGLVCALTEQNVYIPMYFEDDAPAGTNPFGLIPVAVWANPRLPGASRPSSRLEINWSQATWINVLELYAKEVLMRGLPLTIVDETCFSESHLRKINLARGPADVERILVSQGEAQKAIHRIPASEIPASLMAVMEYAHRQLNASTGVADAQRGQPLPGDKTALEVRTLNSAQGIQARHMRSQYAAFLKSVMQKSRMIASNYESGDEIIYADGVTFNTASHNIRAILGSPMSITVSESSLGGSSEEDVAYQRIQQFQAIDMPCLQLGVGDPVKIFSSVYRDVGVSPETRLKSEESIALAQQMQESNEPNSTI